MLSLGIIPARGGSKSIRLKNIKMFNNKHLIEHTMLAANRSNLSKTVVSTDNKKIKSICLAYKNIEVIDRPKQLASDEAPTELSLTHACNFLINKYQFEPEIILILEPTSPLRSTRTINQCINILKNNKKFDSVIGVQKINSPIGRIKNDYYKYLFPNLPRRRQDRECLYTECSTIWGIRYKTFKKKNSVVGYRPYPLIINSIEAYDINDIIDFKIAEAIQKLK